MFNMKKQRQVFLTGEYLELYKELSHHLSYDLPNREQREIALSGVEDLLIEAQVEGRKPETIFGESKDIFYQDLIAAFPNNVGFYDLKKTEHKRQHRLSVITILFVTSVIVFINIFNGIIPLFIFGFRWYEESDDYYKYTSQTQTSRSINIDLGNLEKNVNLVLFENGKCKIMVNYVYLNNLGEYIVHVSTYGGGDFQEGKIVALAIDSNNNPDMFLPYTASKIESTFLGKNYESPLRMIEINSHRDGGGFEFALFDHDMYKDGKLIVNGIPTTEGKVSIKIYHLLEITWKRK